MDVKKKTYRTLHFGNNVLWQTGRRGTLSAPDHPTLNVGGPPAFKGDPDVWCPEDLLIGGLNTCLMLTFLAIAQRRGLQVVGYEASAQGTLEERDGKYRVTTVRVQPKVSVANEVEAKLRDEVVRGTTASCIITYSISGTVEFTPEFRSASQPAA